MNARGGSLIWHWQPMENDHLIFLCSSRLAFPHCQIGGSAVAGKSHSHKAPENPRVPLANRLFYPGETRKPLHLVEKVGTNTTMLSHGRAKIWDCCVLGLQVSIDDHPWHCDQSFRDSCNGTLGSALGVIGRTGITIRDLNLHKLGCNPFIWLNNVIKS